MAKYIELLTNPFKEAIVKRKGSFFLLDDMVREGICFEGWDNYASQAAIRDLVLSATYDTQTSETNADEIRSKPKSTWSRASVREKKTRTSI